jgi:RND family efflux transporter MFP subunit
MHSWYKSDKPGVAPDCGMTLVPVYAEGAQTTAAPANNPPGALQIAPLKQQEIGVRYETAGWSSSDETVRATGRVAVDETRLTRIHSRTDGWVDKVIADFTGKQVTEGQVLLTLYSPELLASQQEFLLALKAHSTMEHSSVNSSMTNAMALVAAARKRLQLLNMPMDEIDQLEKSGEAIHSIPVYSTANGYVLSRNAFPGQRVTTDTDLYTLADLSHVWVIADIFEADAARIHEGQTARVSFAGAGSSIARITNIQPQVDPATRTLKARFELANPDGRYRPDMYAEAIINEGGMRRLTVPAEAVLDAGATKTMFIDLGNGLLESRRVMTGSRTGEQVEIVDGLKPGERYAASGVFLLNSESQMRSGASQAMPDMPGTAPTPGAKKP